MAEIMLQSPAALLAIPLLWLLAMAVAWSRRFKPFGAFLLRLAIIVLIGLALAQPVILPPETPANEQTPERLVVLVDQSASVPTADQQIFQAEAARLAAQFPDTTVLYFADQTVMGAPPSPGETGPESLPLNPNLSNLAQALLMGAQFLNNQPGRLVLLSDGLPTAGDTPEAMAQLARQNIPVDVFVPGETGVARPNEVRLIELTTPATLRLGEIFDANVIVHSERQTEANLRLIQDDDILARETVLLEPGFNRFSFTTEAVELGPHTFRATVSADNDGQPANNSLSAFSQVYPPPPVLVVGDDPVRANTFAGWLEEAGFVPTTLRSNQLPDRLSELEPYAGMALLNVSARSLKLEQMIAVQEFARSLGRGLLVTGGRSSFSLGKYDDTPLAELLPLSLDPPVREERPPVALLLIIDHSGSMVEERGELGTRLVLAKEAAIRATDILGPQDLIGILIFDSETEWVIPFQQVSDGATLLKIQETISRIQPGSATRILKALKASIPALIEQEATSAARHAVLFSDGRSYDQRDSQNPDDPLPDYDAIVDAALAANITLSTISIGGDTDEELMARLADRGLGRYHYAGTPDELPELTISESDILRSSAVQEGDYDPAAAAPHPILRDFLTPGVREAEGIEIPPLTGYIAMTPKPQAEIALQVGSGDPLLGVWGYGLGRVAAWSSDTGQEWTANWLSWPEVDRFWGQILDYSLPAPALGLLQLKAEVESDGVATLTADGATFSGQTVDLASTQATLTTPGGREVSLALRQVEPGRYQQRVRLPDPGVYQLRVTQARPEGAGETALIGFVVPYPAEYDLPAEDVGEPLLKQIAAATGGRVFSPENPLLPATSSAGEAEAIPQPVELWPWLLLVALILWPIEIAWRRWGRLRIQ
ncbi:MAG: VWA domain-containing protein [Anaerolineae bacterium]|nr:VWA domain-containing protein [Anaerolineae bacterium]